MTAPLSPIERKRFSAPGGWTAARVHLLRDLWFAPGQTRSTIAAALGPGFTLNAVVGKAHRLGLVKRGKQVAKRPIAPESISGLEAAMRVKPIAGSSSKLQFNSAPSRLPAPLPRAVEDTDPGFKCEPVTISELCGHHCRWPLSPAGTETEAFFYCGKTKSATYGSFCPAHSAIAYNPLALRRVNAMPHW